MPAIFWDPNDNAPDTALIEQLSERIAAGNGWVGIACGDSLRFFICEKIHGAVFIGDWEHFAASYGIGDALGIREFPVFDVGIGNLFHDGFDLLGILFQDDILCCRTCSDQTAYDEWQ